MVRLMTSIKKRGVPDIIGEPRLTQVGEDVAVAEGFALGNVIKIGTRDGAVVVDTSSTATAAAGARDASAEVVPGPVRYLVYTHCHNDHTSGAEALVSDETEDIVAHDLLVPLVDRDHGCLANWTTRIRAAQRGRPGEEPFADRAFLPPTLTFGDSLDLEVGDRTFHLEHTEGESRDHLLVWVPELRLLCPGDLVYPSFPNLSSPAIGPRPIEGWIRSLDRFLALEPDHLVPSHGPPLSGREAIQEVLTAYRDAIQHVWDASVRAIDDGVDVHTAARTIQLPEPLARHPWLQPIYGTPGWGVRAVYAGLTGWYDLKPASLNPLPRPAVHTALVDAVGAEPVLDRARAALEDGDPQLALELTDLVLDADSANQRAWRLQLDACRALRAASTSVNELGFYHSGVVTARQQLEALG